MDLTFYSLLVLNVITFPFTIVPGYPQHVQHQQDNSGQKSANFQPQQPRYIQQQPRRALVVQQRCAIARVVMLQRERPNSHLAWSICGCLCCVLPIGILPIFLSQKSSSAYDEGDPDAAEKYSKSALVTNIVNMLLGAAMFTTLIVLLMSSKQRLYG